MAFESMSDKMSNTFKKMGSKGKLNENDIRASMREIRMTLLEADVNYQVAKDFIDNVTERAIGQDVLESLTPAQQVFQIVQQELTDLMGGENEYIHLKSTPPTVIMLCGLQGSGKTTHAAKLGKYFTKKGNRPLLVACDVYRPAAIEQLKVVGESADVPVFTMDIKKPEVIAKEAVAKAKDHGNDIVILDTAGRLHVDDELMDELRRIKNDVNVDETLLIVDAMVGQDAVNVAKTFNEEIGVDGVILTKLDGDTRGGAALSVRAVTGRPIKFAGVGEKLDDLEAFHPERMAGRILGMGDVATLVEKAQEVADEKEAEKTARRLLENKFDMNDLLSQIKQMRRMGGVGAMLQMMPGNLTGGASADDVDEGEFVRIEAIIQSMTPEERANPKLLKMSRKRRISAGSGTTPQDINRLLKMYNEMNQVMKQFKRNPRKFGRMARGMRM